MSLLSCQNLSFAYPGGRPVLREFSLELVAGDFVGLIGPNGAGKSTIVRLLSGFLKPQSGEIRLRGADLARYSARRRAAIMAVLPQHVHASLPFTVRELVALGRTSRLSHWLPQSAADKAKVAEALDSLDLLPLADQPFHQLSGGERQRTLLAAALAQEPEILLLDEPTSALDLGHAAAFMKLLRRFNRERGLTVLVISHDLELMARYVDRITLLYAGKVLGSGAPGEILTPELIERAYQSRVKVISGVHGEPLLSHL